MLRRLRQLPVKRDVVDIETFINRELIPFLLELTQQATDEDGNVIDDALRGRPAENGIDGEDGLDGHHGRDGKDGKDGNPGRDGTDGEDGLDGRPGKDGASGAAGTPGKDGADGEDGLDGKPGKDGINGVAGATGQSGIDGEDGLDGRPGAPGRDGAVGLQGPPGPPGRDGEEGLRGPPGPGLTDGDKGDITVTGQGAFMTVDVDIDKAWTGVHSFTSSAFSVALTGGDVLLSTTSGIGLFANHTPAAVDGGDIVLNATSGIYLNNSLSAATGVQGIRADSLQDILLQSASGIGLYAAHTAGNVDGGDVVINATSGVSIVVDPTTPVHDTSGIRMQSSADVRCFASSGVGLFAALADADVATGDVVANAAGGLGLFAGYATAVVDVSSSDMVLNCAGGMAIRTDNTATPVVAVTNGNMEFGAYGRFIFTGSSFYQVEVSSDVWLSTTGGGIELNTLNAGHPTGVTNGQINLNSQLSIGLAATTSLIFSTAGTERLEIESDGAWQLAGNTGSRGDTMTSYGSSAPPAWEQRSFSSIGAFSNLTSTTPRTIATKTFAANEAVQGTTYRFSAYIFLERGGTATAVEARLEFRVAGTVRAEVFGNINATPAFSGGLRLQGEIVFHDAPGAAANYSVSSWSLDCSSSGPTVPTVSLNRLDTGTAATNGAVTIDVRASISAVVADVDAVPIHAYIERVIL